jgi:RNA polymerase sigma-70 factor (ECF subfamily)
MLRLLNLIKLLLAVNVLALLATTIGLTGATRPAATGPDSLANSSSQEAQDRGGNLDFRARAFTALYATHLNPIRSFLQARLSNTEVVEDVAAEVFTRAWLKLDFTAAPESAVSWLYTTARNLAIDQHRRLRPTVPLDALAVDQEPLTAPLEELMTDSERDSHVRTALSTLAPREQHVLALRFAAGLPHRQIAPTVGTTEGNAAKIQHRALHKLRPHLDGLQDAL